MAGRLSEVRTLANHDPEDDACQGESSCSVRAKYCPVSNRVRNEESKDFFPDWHLSAKIPAKYWRLGSRHASSTSQTAIVAPTLVERLR